MRAVRIQVILTLGLLIGGCAMRPSEVPPDASRAQDMLIPDYASALQGHSDDYIDFMRAWLSRTPPELDRYLTTWDRSENDLDRSPHHLLREHGHSAPDYFADRACGGDGFRARPQVERGCLSTGRPLSRFRRAPSSGRRRAPQT